MMNKDTTTATSSTSKIPKVELVPRGKGQGYSDDEVVDRRKWIEDKTSSNLEHISNCSIPYDSMRGNIENPIGSAQVPLGVAGPLKINGEFANNDFYVPLATTEGALVRSYERGMVVISKSGGANSRIIRDENQITPTFFFNNLVEGSDFCKIVNQNIEKLKTLANATTSHGKCLDIETRVSGLFVYLTIRYFTADAQGMNMIVKASDAICQWLVKNSSATKFQIFSGFSMEKRPSGGLLQGGKGKTVTADILIPQKILSLYLRVKAKDINELWQQTMIGNKFANALGYCGHFANGLTAIFIATGQDIANIANSAVGVTHFQERENGALYASVTLTALTIGTVGGGTSLPTSKEALSMIDCYGSNGCKKFAEIIAASLLAGEISMAAAIASGEFVNAHEYYGRNRPEETK